MLSMSSGLMSLRRPPTCDACPANPPDTATGPTPDCEFTRTLSMYTRGLLPNDRLLRPRIWIDGAAPRRAVVLVRLTFGERALIRLVRLVAADLASSSLASIR